MSSALACVIIVFLSTLSLRRATLKQFVVGDVMGISIHALLAESDLRATCGPAGGRTFLSTLSLRRATGIGFSLVLLTPNFYPRSPCGERRAANCQQRNHQPYFYPRSPCGERPIF